MNLFAKIAAVVGTCLALGGFASAPASSSPTTPAASAIASAPATAHPLTAEDVAAYFDGMLPSEMERADIAGVIIVVVKDGKPLFERGYGLADVKSGRPVEPDATLFRPGSISKLFTWTAVMQLVEAGKIDLDADINRYLDFKVPPYDGKPMTMRQLMTHSAGFADASKDLFPPDLKHLKSMSQMREVAMPARIFAPGSTPAYSNYGASLAGYIVQRVSGERFEDYIAHHIFAPLGMAHSTFEQPLPQGWSANMSKGYRTASGHPGPFELVQMPPAGALATTGSDLSRFMIAHLQDGEFQGQRILGAKTAEYMHSLQFQPVPQLPGMALGFYQEPANGHRVIGHAGDTGLFHSDLHLYLDDNVGLYISLNSAGTGGAGSLGSGLRTSVFRGFSNRYFPATRSDAIPTWSNAKADGQTLSGYYIDTGRSEASWTRIRSFLLGQTKVASDNDGVVTISSYRGVNHQLQRWREIGPFQYQAIGSASRMAAVVRDGKVSLIMRDDYPPVEALQPVPATLSASWNLPLLYLSGAILAIAALTWPLSAIIRGRYGHRFELSAGAATLYRLTRAVCCGYLAFGYLWYWLLTKGGHASSGSDWIVRLIQLLGVVCLVGTIAPLLNVRTVFADPARSWWAKVSSVAIAAACLAAIWFVASLHLITLNIAY
ncbi:serine hydrolase domain-containing protein [Phenylobacterium sp.]|uniref:serine hydrolase domain-containing protein n=1 Tax=Phenylobacterium sp. TaxID=1871053 RepID=UPI002F405E86